MLRAPCTEIPAMIEQKFIRTYLNPDQPGVAMDRIRHAAGEGSWRVVSILPVGEAVAARRMSPGNNDPQRFEGMPVLVLVERDAAEQRRVVRRERLDAVN